MHFFIGFLSRMRPVTIVAIARDAVFADLAPHDLRAPIAARARADVARTIYYRRRKGTPAMLEELARKDGLTGLFNYRWLKERLSEEFRRAQRHGDADHRRCRVAQWFRDRGP